MQALPPEFLTSSYELFFNYLLYKTDKSWTTMNLRSTSSMSISFPYNFLVQFKKIPSFFRSLFFIRHWKMVPWNFLSLQKKRVFVAWINILVNGSSSKTRISSYWIGFRDLLLASRISAIHRVKCLHKHCLECFLSIHKLFRKQLPLSSTFLSSLLEYVFQTGSPNMDDSLR